MVWLLKKPCIKRRNKVQARVKRNSRVARKKLTKCQVFFGAGEWRAFMLDGAVSQLKSEAKPAKAKD